jgi:hypothetical protein
MPENLPESFLSAGRKLVQGVKELKNTWKKYWKPGEIKWIAGLVMITLGLALFFLAFHYFHSVNWWALFIFIPAVVSLEIAYRAVINHHRRLNKSAIIFLVIGIALALTSNFSLFNQQAEMLAPMNFMIIGAALLVDDRIIGF